MLEGLKHLLDLQRLDDELGAVEREHAAIPANRSRIAESRQAGQARVDTSRRDLAAGEVAQRGAEKDLQDREALLHKLEGQQFQVRSNEAYTALLHEMDAARRAISDCETRILESMDVIETSRDGLRSAERAAREEGGRLDAEEKRLAEREVELTAEIARLRGERVRLVSGIAAELRERYERIASRRRPAVVLISKELCEGCRVDIPPQSYIEILRGERIVTCGQCQRILVHQEKLAARSAS